LADNIGFQYSWSGNGQSGISVPRPQLGSINFTSDRAFFVLVLVVLAICVVVVAAISRGTTGRQLAALRGSELAAASIGVNPARLKIIVFALSAGIAGVGGALYASLDQSVSSSDFNTLISLVLVVVIATVGVSSIEGAIEAGVAYVLVNTVLTSDLPSQYSSLLELVFGAGVIVYVLHPEGVVELSKRFVLDHVLRRPIEPEAVV
jgi:ABC-type branched-subunit amino acid transport system permease subunit